MTQERLNGMNDVLNSSNIAIVVILALFKLIEHLLKMNKTNVSMLTEIERHQLSTLFDQHSVKDSTGRPLWYMPQHVGKQQEKIIQLIDDMIKTQNDTMHVLERILDKLNENRN